MELVPIVITALEIVFALTAITLVVSYIAYKMRAKNASPGTAEPAYRTGPSHRRINRLTQFTKEIIHMPRHHEAPRKQKPPQGRLPAKENHEPRKEHRAAEESKPKRLEVVKEIVPQPSTRIKKSSEETKHPTGPFNSLGDDILNKYSDEADHKLYSLKTKKDNRDNK
jgi:hypothetical protein